MEQDLIDQTD